ncbi:MAG: hypothetical protein ABR600_01570 [Actinomycetota bacterium]
MNDDSKQSQGAYDQGTVDGNGVGTFQGDLGTIDAFSPDHGPDKSILRSIYVVHDQKNLIELGWLWTPDQDTATAQGYPHTTNQPTVFAVREVRGVYKPYLEDPNPVNTGWGTLSNGAHTFQIIHAARIADPTVDTSYWNLYRDGKFVRIIRVGFDRGYVSAASEAFGLCDSLLSHYSSMQKLRNINPNSGWELWGSPTPFKQHSEWWWYSPSAVNAWQVLHCQKEFCHDYTGLAP